MHVFIAGFQHETNTFAPTKADWAAFEAGAGYPPYRRGPEVVEVPAGKFTAVKVTVTVREFDQIIWYAPGVGEVKRTVKKNGVEAVMRSLKSFADGKK
ncbi:MAG: M81 family metallopeptidase [Variovorax sp.]|nr:M81 family metallopeptidase [Variovorax sp.]